jgi:hypothetical protein
MKFETFVIIALIILFGIQLYMINCCNSKSEGFASVAETEEDLETSNLTVAGKLQIGPTTLFWNPARNALTLSGPTGTMFEAPAIEADNQLRGGSIVSDSGLTCGQGDINLKLVI